MNDSRTAAPLAAQATFGLKPGVSFCRVDGRIVFLDVAADRYLCLSPAGEQAFARLAEGLGLDERHLAVLDSLARTGPLRRGDRASVIAPCPGIDVPRASRLDETACAGFAETLAAAACLARSPLLLRVFGLHRTLAGIARRKSAAANWTGPQRQASAAAAFARLRLFAAEKDNCLVRSIAVAEGFIAIGARPQLVIAVKLRPFYAHAWVQCDGWLVNDRHEFVRNYTPILVV